MRRVLVGASSSTLRFFVVALSSCVGASGSSALGDSSMSLGFGGCSTLFAFDGPSVSCAFGGDNETEDSLELEDKLPTVEPEPETPHIKHNLEV